jgi:biotin carboxylase
VNNNPKVLVVGTTPDYIEWIRRASPGRALFLTDAVDRERAEEPCPNRFEEVVSSLEDYPQVKNDLRAHLERWNIHLNGIACFDCESMELAAMLGRELSLPYPTLESIRLCRDKYACKELWHQHQVQCPQVRLVRSAKGVIDFLQDLNGSCVIKPVSGSGSELVFNCYGKSDCEKWTAILLKGLKEMRTRRLYSDAGSWFLAEEFIEGDEYSCDFIVRDHGVEIIRLTKKIHGHNKPFGTIEGYALRRYPSEAFSSDIFEHTLYTGAKALGLFHAICMVDFLVHDDNIFLLEMTPRPGGDCIPHLLRRSGIIDSLIMTLDFAQQRPLSLARERVNREYIGLRLHAGKNGKIVNIDTRILEEDPRVQEINLIRKPGHLVVMPPHDYESWYLGYVIFQAENGPSIEDQCHDLYERLVVEIIS